MKPGCLLIFILSLSPLASAIDSVPQPAPPGHVIAGLKDVRIESVRRMRGKGFNWDHDIQIALPASYGKTNRFYPVLWVTDGPMYFELAVKTVNYDLRWHLPEMIVVAVGPPAGELGEFSHRRAYEFTSAQTREFVGFGADLMEKELATAEQQRKAAGAQSPKRGGAALFLTFLVDEMRPVLSRDYRMGHDQVLFGDSGGGMFCVYALFARPEAFSRYICGSPPLSAGDFELFRMEERYAKANKDLKATVFLGAGEAEILQPQAIIPASGVVSSTVRMAEILGLRKYPSLQLSVRIFAGEDHASVAPFNLSGGLRSVFAGDARKSD